MHQLMSEKNDLVLKAMRLARKDMKPIIKDATNPFHKSKYATLGSFIEATDDALYEHGLIITACTGKEDGDTVLVTILSHVESGQWVRSQTPLLNTKGDSQGLGSAITYMRRYSLSALLNISPDEDDDGAKSCVRPSEKKEKLPEVQSPPKKKDANFLEKVDEKQVGELREIVALAGSDIAIIVNQFLQSQYDNVKSWKDTPKEAFSACMRSFRMNIEKRLKENVA